MKTLAEKIKAAFGKNSTIAIERVEHPNFWMYQ
jgi:hypothetical protein